MGKHKYMAWVIGQKRMVRVAGLNFSDPIQIEVPRIGMEEIEGSAWDDPDYFEFWYEGTEAILLQCIGLRDKNLIEMYKGDVVEYRDDSGTMQIGVIKDRGYLEMYVEAVGGDEEGNQDGQLHPDVEFEVIGNIYENPKLVEPPCQT